MACICHKHDGDDECPECAKLKKQGIVAEWTMPSASPPSTESSLPVEQPPPDNMKWCEPDPKVKLCAMCHMNASDSQHVLICPGCRTKVQVSLGGNILQANFFAARDVAINAGFSMSVLRVCDDFIDAVVLENSRRQFLADSKYPASTGTNNGNLKVVSRK
jgi:hypothetical protein